MSVHHDTGLAAVREWQRAGCLAERYPELARVVRDLPWPERARVGAWLQRVSADALRAAHPALPSLRVVLTGNATIAPVAPHLAAAAAAHGLILDLHVAGFGAYRQDLLNPSSELYAARPQIAACLLDAHAISDELPLPFSAQEIEAVLDRRRNELEAVVRAFTAHDRDGLLLLNTVPLDRMLTHQLVDHRSRCRLGAAWRRFNAWLLELGAEHDGVVCLDIEVAAAAVALAPDPGLSAYGRQHLPDGVLAHYASELVHVARNLEGRTRKCLVLDLDNTLWGGVLAEDGPEGIVLGGDYEGEAFVAFQRVVKQLASQGVLLAISSKNDADEVRRTMREHPAMALRDEDFAAISANWRPKSDNVAEIARALNLDPDHFVFVDDSRFECELVASRHPGTAVVCLGTDPALHAQALLAEGWFTVRELTGEDRKRVASYRSAAEREGFLASCASLEDYLCGLNIRVRVSEPSDAELPRLAQLTQRTNQFNLTTVRHDAASVASRALDPEWLVLAIRAADRFGDDGVVGCVFAQKRDGWLDIENFVLSCRVFSRGIETAALAELLRRARERGAIGVLGRYAPSPKNGRVRDFYARHGFRPAGEHDEQRLSVHDLRALPAVPTHLTIDQETEVLPA